MHKNLFAQLLKLILGKKEHSSFESSFIESVGKTEEKNKKAEERVERIRNSIHQGARRSLHRFRL